MRTFLDQDAGQSLLLVAGGFAMLLIAVAFSADWGYGFAQRRAMSNAAQAGALAAGRLLATSATMVKDPVTLGTYPAFPGATAEVSYKEACTFFLGNLGPTVTSATYSMTVEFLDNSGTALGSAITEAFPASSSTCNSPTTSTAIPTSTTTQWVDVRVTAGVSYTALFGTQAGTSSVTAANTARARVAGAPITAAAGGVWPMVRQYNRSEFDGALCPPAGSPPGTQCDPTNITPLPFWDSGGSFKALIDFSRYSPHTTDATVPQLIDTWDQSGSYYATPSASFKPDQTGNGCNQPAIPTWTNGKWDTSGVDDGNKIQCSIANWAYQGFSGTLSVSRNWVTGVTGQQEAPGTVPTTRTQCTSLPSWLSAPSCSDGRLGDWVEGTTSSGNGGQNIASALCWYIRTNPTKNGFESQATPGGGNSACQGNTYPDGGSYTNGTFGRSRTVYVFLWDCVETYSKTHAMGDRWDLYLQGGDCPGSSPSSPPPAGNKVDRVHLFAIAPFTFYEGLISSSSISGFWGGAFGNTDSCPTHDCSLNAVSNTTFLVGE